LKRGIKTGYQLLCLHEVLRYGRVVADVFASAIGLI